MEREVRPSSGKFPALTDPVKSGRWHRSDQSIINILIDLISVTSDSISGLKLADPRLQRKSEASYAGAFPVGSARVVFLFIGTCDLRTTSDQARPSTFSSVFLPFSLLIVFLSHKKNIVVSLQREKKSRQDSLTRYFI